MPTPDVPPSHEEVYASSPEVPVPTDSHLVSAPTVHAQERIGSLFGLSITTETPVRSRLTTGIFPSIESSN